jgi:hypothetical protein
MKINLSSALQAASQQSEEAAKLMAKVKKYKYLLKELKKVSGATAQALRDSTTLNNQNP